MTKKRFWFFKFSPGLTVCFPVLFLFAVALSCGPAAAAVRKAKNAHEQGWQRQDKTVLIEGHIENVTPRAVEVAGQYYVFSGVPVLNERGQASSPAQFIRGREIKLFLSDGVLNRIIVYENLVVQ